jgi:hypothetical protein
MTALKRSVIGAVALTIGCASSAAIGVIADPVLTPMRATFAVLLATGLGLAWGRVIWNMRH